MRIFAGLSAIALLMSSPALAVSPWTVFFESNSSHIDRQSAAILDNVAASFRAVRIRGFRVFGHTDRVGPAAYNRRLAQRRAEAVRAALARRGVPLEAIETVATGEDQPLVETEDDVAEPQNRRVEILITCIDSPRVGFDYIRCQD